MDNKNRIKNMNNFIAGISGLVIVIIYFLSVDDYGVLRLSGSREVSGWSFYVIISFWLIVSFYLLISSISFNEVSKDSHSLHIDHLRSKIRELDNYLERRRKPSSDIMEQLNEFLSQSRDLNLNDNTTIDNLDREFSEKLTEVDNLPE